jgi:hypothetical protein
MSQTAPFDSVFRLETQLGASWPNLRTAFEATIAEHQQLNDSVGDVTREDTSIVVLGSAGRFEVTSGSDTDWTFLVDGQAQPEHRTAANRVAEGIDKKSGREGIFGKLAFSHDLIHYIGGQDDTNANLTRRILLLLESKPIGERRAYDSVVRNVLERYLSGDHGWIRRRTRYCVPRFLHNDIARYWRTVTVDYAYKHWTRSGQGWALRSAKLRLSRKLTYAAGLLYAFELASAEEHPPGPVPSSLKQEAIERLWEVTNGTPLDLLAALFLGDGTGRYPTLTKIYGVF